MHTFTYRDVRCYKVCGNAGFRTLCDIAPTVAILRFTAHTAFCERYKCLWYTLSVLHIVFLPSWRCVAVQEQAGRRAVQREWRRAPDNQTLRHRVACTLCGPKGVSLRAS